MNKISEHLKDVIKILGSQRALANEVHVGQQTVSKWIKKGKVPATKAILIERAVNGAVTRHQLRPDLYPEE